MNKYGQRLRTLACKHWGISPAQFDDQARQRQFVLRDVLDLVGYMASDELTGPSILRYVMPERIERAQQKRVQSVRQNRYRGNIAMLLNFVKPKNEKEAAFLENLRAKTCQPVNT